MNIYHIGDSCISFQFSEKIDNNISIRILYVYRALKNIDLLKGFSICDIVPAYGSLAFYFTRPVSTVYTVIEKLRLLIESILSDYIQDSIQIVEKPVIIPVFYNGADLERIAEIHGFSEEEVVRKHTAPLYLVAMIGFRPHFPYLIGLDCDLETPRLDSPRLKIPAGSVAIGGAQTGIYPEESPGGWNLIGTMNPNLLINIKPGDYIRFEECRDIC